MLITLIRDLYPPLKETCCQRLSILWVRVPKKTRCRYRYCTRFGVDCLAPESRRSRISICPVCHVPGVITSGETSAGIYCYSLHDNSPALMRTTGRQRPVICHARPACFPHFCCRPIQVLRGRSTGSGWIDGRRQRIFTQTKAQDSGPRTQRLQDAISEHY
jgi:hypothetical protein